MAFNIWWFSFDTQQGHYHGEHFMDKGEIVLLVTQHLKELCAGKESMPCFMKVVLKEFIRFHLGDN